MSTIPVIVQTQTSLPAIWRRSLSTSRVLTWSVLVYAILFVGTVLLSIIDSRVVTGAPVWFKPMKFAISTSLYIGTLAWMLSYVEGKRWLVNVITAGTAVGFAVELIAIVFQAARGVRSHFNMTTPLDATLFGFMGAFVMVIWVMNLATAVLLMRQKLPDRAFAWSLRLGLLVTAVGAGMGFLMTQPTDSQMAALQAGETVSILGAHSVGVEDGGPGLPFTGWSVTGGDLRVPHFVGIHALQIIPLVGYVVNRRWGRRLSDKRRAALVAISALGYLGLVLLLIWQALRGQPVIAPDALTLTALAGVVGSVLVAGTAVFATTNNKI